MIERASLAVRSPSAPMATSNLASPEDGRGSPSVVEGPDSDPQSGCIWISSTGPTSLEAVCRAVQERLSTRLVTSELVYAAPPDGPSVPGDLPPPDDLIEHLARAASALARRDRAVVVAGPRLSTEATRTMRERFGRLVRVSLHPAVVDGGPPPIPTIYWFVQGPQILEATIPPRIADPGGKADIVVGGALRPPDQLAGEIVEALFRAGWLPLPPPEGTCRITDDSTGERPGLAATRSRAATPTSRVSVA